MTDRELFERVRGHLLKQNSRSTDESGSNCRYRSEDGTMCAVGCLISDECYVPSMETWSVDHPAVIEALLQSGVADDQLTMLQVLQDVHDLHDPARWSDVLNEFTFDKNGRFLVLEDQDDD